MPTNHYTRAAKGSKKEIRPGVWQIRVSAGYRKDGTQRRKMKTIYGSEIDADAGIIQLAAEMGTCLSAGDNITLNEYFYSTYLPLREATTTKANVRTNKSIFKCHISPTLGEYPLDAISNTIIQRWLNGLPPQTAPAAMRILRAVLNQAAFDHMIDRSPMDYYRFKYPKGRVTNPNPVWDAQTVRACLDKLTGYIRPLWLVMVGGGLSKSEALALDVDDIAFTETVIGNVKVVRAIVSVTKAYTNVDGMKEPKNSRRIRKVPISPVFAEPLRECLPESGAICQYNGKRANPCTVSLHWEKKFRVDENGVKSGELADLTYIPLGRMRATWSTMMQSIGTDTTLINAMQGRSRDSSVAYSNYLAPNMATYFAAQNNLDLLVSGE